MEILPKKKEDGNTSVWCTWFLGLTLSHPGHQTNIFFTFYRKLFDAWKKNHGKKNWYKYRSHQIAHWFHIRIYRFRIGFSVVNTIKWQPKIPKSLQPGLLAIGLLNEKYPKYLNGIFLANPKQQQQQQKHSKIWIMIVKWMRYEIYLVMCKQCETKIHANFPSHLPFFYFYCVTNIRKSATFHSSVNIFSEPKYTPNKNQ